MEKEPIHILWTPMDANADDFRVCHFVPLIKWEGITGILFEVVSVAVNSC